MNSKSSKYQQPNFFLLLSILTILPWFRGGEVNWQYFFFTFLIFLTLCISLLKKRKSSFVSLATLKPALVCWCLFVAYIFMQTIPLPIDLLKFISPEIFIWYFDTNEVLGEEPVRYIPLTLSSHATMIEGFKQASYLALFTVTLITIQTSKQAKIVLIAIISTTTLAALYAIANYLTKGDVFYLAPLPPWNASNYDTITGPFSYKNHFAALLIITIPLSIGLLATIKESKLKGKTVYLIDWFLSAKSILIAISAFLFLVLIFNTSRAALLALFVGCLLTLILFKPIKTKTILTKNIARYSIVLTVFCLFVIFSGLSDRLIKRVETYGENGRDIQRQTALAIFSDFPITGSGAGTFPLIQHSYKSENLSGNKMWQHVHNEYLELLSDQGIVGFALMGLVMGLLMYKLYLSISANYRSTRSLQIGCFASCFTLLLHCVADFDFKLPALAIYFFAVLAVGLRLVEPSKRVGRSYG